jgi:hypothetical protein
MSRLTSSQFMHTLPAATREHLPVALRRFKSFSRGWLCQLYYREALLHYEVWNLGERRGLLEIGLHFESKNRATNLALLNGFERHMVEVKATLGPHWEAEMWDRGWTKVYETVPYAPFSSEVLDEVAQRLARAITILQPIWDSLPKN